MFWTEMSERTAWAFCETCGKRRRPVRAYIDDDGFVLHPQCRPCAKLEPMDAFSARLQALGLKV